MLHGAKLTRVNWMSRKRVIVDIVNLEQALRLEQTVRTGYCEAITEDLVAWIAVEEDLAASYEKLSGTYSKQEMKEAMLQLSEKSKNKVGELNGLLKVVSGFSAVAKEKESLIENLIASNSGNVK